MINGLNKYDDGMLMVCINKSANIGLVYIDSDYYRTIKTTVSFKRIHVNKFDKLILPFDKFTLKLKDMLYDGIIITPELYKNSMSPSHYTECESIERFIKFCIEHKLKYELNYDNSSPTDLFVEGYKIQMKYCSKSIGEKTNNHSYHISLRRSGFIKYKKGDNDFYVIEIGGYHNNFLWLPENLLIAKGYVSENIMVDENSKYTLDIFPYDYIEKKLLTTDDKHKHQVKGNWSCNKKYWISTEKGCLNGLPDVNVHIKNLSSEFFITSDKLKFMKSDDELLKDINIIEESSQKKSFKVKQYDLKGNYIKTFDDVGTAAKEVKIQNNCISMACKSNSKISAGFKWEFDINETSTNNTKLDNGIKKKVNQYNLEGVYIKTFNSVSDAARICGLKITQITNVCNKKSDDAGEFIWRFTNFCTNSTNNLTIEEIKRPSHRTKQVDQFDLNGVFIRRFDSLNQASKELTDEKNIFFSFRYI